MRARPVNLENEGMTWSEFWWIFGAYLAGSYVNGFVVTLWKHWRKSRAASGQSE